MPFNHRAVGPTTLIKTWPFEWTWPPSSQPHQYVAQYESAKWPPPFEFWKTFDLVFEISRLHTKGWPFPPLQMFRGNEAMKLTKYIVTLINQITHVKSQNIIKWFEGKKKIERYIITNTIKTRIRLRRCSPYRRMRPSWNCW